MLGIKGYRYVIQKGDTLYDIGKRFGVNWRIISFYNQLDNPHLIYENQIIYIPFKGGKDERQM